MLGADSSQEVLLNCTVSMHIYLFLKASLLVGARYVQRMDSILQMVDYITSQMAIKLVTYFAEKTETMPKVDLNNSPAMV